MSEETKWVGIDPAIDTSQLIGRMEVTARLGLHAGPSLRGWERNEHFPAPLVQITLPDGRRMSWWNRADIEAFVEIKPELLKQARSQASTKRIAAIRAKGGTFAHPHKNKKPTGTRIRVSKLPNVEGEAK